MKNKYIQSARHFFSSAMFISLLGLIIFLLVSSFPSKSLTDVTYPGPDYREATALPLSPQELCDHWFSYRRSLQNEKRAIAEEEYMNCISARLTPSPVGLNKPKPDASPQGTYFLSVFTRPAGNGIIFESSLSPLNSIYKIRNQWNSDIDGLHFTVFAGGRRSDEASGLALYDYLSWHGILVITVKGSGGEFIPEKGGEYLTPKNAGPVRVVASSGNEISVVAIDGTAFVFDLVNRKFLDVTLSIPFSRFLDAGLLVESGDTPYPIDGFGFVNYWYSEQERLGKLTILARYEVSDPKTGVLILLISSPHVPLKIDQLIVYRTILSDGALRIVDGSGDKLTLISEEDMIYEFDIASHQFVSLPSGTGILLGNPLPTFTPNP